MCGRQQGPETPNRGGVGGDVVQVIPVCRSLDKERVSQIVSEILVFISMSIISTVRRQNPTD